MIDIIYQTWAGKTAKEYKKFKGLNKELVLHMLATLSKNETSEATDLGGFDKHKSVARQRGEVTRCARLELEAPIGKKEI